MLTGLKSTVVKTINREGQAQGAIPGVAQIGGKRSRTSQESAEETYDPFWTNAFSFLRDLEVNFAVPLNKARMGSLVKFDAFLQFVDLRIMRSLWDPAAQVWAGSHPEPNPSYPKKKQREMRTAQQLSPEVKFGLDIVKELPHLIHMTFLTASDEITLRLWAAIKPEHLTISSEDLTMKYGAVIDGKWTVVGLIDAKIGESPDPLPVNELLDVVIRTLVNVRTFIGRPKDHWGLTPIAIYTPMIGVAETETAPTDSEGPRSTQ